MGGNSVLLSDRTLIQNELIALTPTAGPASRSAHSAKSSLVNRLRFDGSRNPFVIVHIINTYLKSKKYGWMTKINQQKTKYILHRYRHFSIYAGSISAVYDSILFSSPLLQRSNLDLRGFCFRVFFLCLHINSVNRGMPVY